MADIHKEFKKVGTHNGRFHADEVMATAILKELFEVEVTRTRDGEVLRQLDIVYDVGDGEFDHHSVEKQRRENGTPYAACGLVWRRFGRDIIHLKNPELSEENMVRIFSHIDSTLIEGIDAIDNGVRASVTIIPIMNISSIVSSYNPPWDSEVSEVDVLFSKAVDFASITLGNVLRQQISEVKAMSLISDAYARRPRPEVLLLDSAYPWGGILKEIDINKEVLFVVFPRDSEYLIQTVRGGGGTFGNRKSLPKAWAGKRDEELNGIVGIDDAVFCHPARFIAGAKSFESVMKMADIAVAEPVETVRRGFLHSLRRLFFRKYSSIRRV